MWEWILHTKLFGYTVVQVIHKTNNSTIFKVSKDDTFYIMKRTHHSNQEEYDIMNSVIHPNICHIEKSFQKKRHSFYVMKMYPSDLFDIIETKPNIISEEKIIHFTRQLVNAVACLHSNGIIHGDIKPENIMVEDDEIFLIDFGCSRRIKEDEYFHSHIGTLSYMSPEMILHHYNTKTDMWNVGLVVFVLYFGFHPFQNYKNVKESILRGFDSESRDRKGFGAFFPEDSYISIDGRNFIRDLLTIEKTRMSASEAIEHVFLKGRKS